MWTYTTDSMDFVTVSTGLILPYWMGLPIRYIQLGDGPLADAILDRIRNSSYTILLKGRSLREDNSKNQII